jgi:hypothetical protein
LGISIVAGSSHLAIVTSIAVAGSLRYNEDFRRRIDLIEDFQVRTHNRTHSYAHPPLDQLRSHASVAHVLN